MISLVSSSVNFIIYCIFGEKFRRVLLQRVAGCQGYHLRTHSNLRQELHNLEVSNYCYVDFHRQILFKTSCLKQSPQSRGFKLLSRWYWSKRTHVFAGRWVDGATCADTRPDHLMIWPFITMQMLLGKYYRPDPDSEHSSVSAAPHKQHQDTGHKAAHHQQDTQDMLSSGNVISNIWMV